jgi:ribosomal protein S18 acetylase RimI-like enzyme
VTEDSAAAVAALPGVLAEVEASGARPWLQTRSGHAATQAAAQELGLTHVETVPAMVVRRGELEDPQVDVEVALIDEHEIAVAVAMLAEAFAAPEDVLARFAGACASMPESSWYVGRGGGEVVSTALGVTLGEATGIFNVATPSEHRRRGYGAALTARAVRDGFAAGSKFAFLQSSELGLSVYRSLGFREVEEYALHTRPEP